MSESRDLRAWAGSLSPAWQAVVPGSFAWAVTVVRPALLTLPSSMLAVLALTLLLSGPLLERAAPRWPSRMIAFWGFAIASLLALATSGAPAPVEPAEAIVAVSSWAVFAVTVAAPALGPAARGLHSLPDPTLSPRRAASRTVWPLFALALLVSVLAFAVAQSEPLRERATALTLLAALAAVLMFAAIGSQAGSGKKAARVHVSSGGVALGVALLIAAAVLTVRTWRAQNEAAPEVAPKSE